MTENLFLTSHFSNINFKELMSDQQSPVSNHKAQKGQNKKSIVNHPNENRKESIGSIWQHKNNASQDQPSSRGLRTSRCSFAAPNTSRGTSGGNPNTKKMKKKPVWDNETSNNAVETKKKVPYSKYLAASRKMNKENTQITVVTEPTPYKMNINVMPSYMQGTKSTTNKRTNSRRTPTRDNTPPKIQAPESVPLSKYESLEAQMRIQDIVIAKLQLKASELRNDLADNKSKFKSSQLQIESLQGIIRLKDEQIH
jgi:hypothetical protein